MHRRFTGPTLVWSIVATWRTNALDVVGVFPFDVQKRTE